MLLLLRVCETGFWRVMNPEEVLLTVVGKLTPLYLIQETHFITLAVHTGIPFHVGT